MPALISSIVAFVVAGLAIFGLVPHYDGMSLGTLPGDYITTNQQPMHTNKQTEQTSRSTTTPVIVDGRTVTIKNANISFLLPPGWSVASSQYVNWSDRIGSTIDISNASGKLAATIDCPIRPMGFEGAEKIGDLQKNSRSFEYAGVTYSANYSYQVSKNVDDTFGESKPYAFFSSVRGKNTDCTLMDWKAFSKTDIEGLISIYNSWRSPEQSSISVPGMSKYTDTDFGFSFWYPIGWQVEKQKEVDVILIRHGPVIFEIDEASGNTSRLPNQASNRTMGGLAVFVGSNEIKSAKVVQLNNTHYLVVIPSTSTIIPDSLVNTIMSTDPSVATPVSANEQIKIIQAEKDAYVGW